MICFNRIMDAAFGPAPIGKRPRQLFTFSMVKIPIGSELTFLKDETKIATVTGDREIEFEGARYTLSRITKELLKNDFGRNWDHPVQGPKFWKFENEKLTDRRKRFEDSSD